MTAKNVPDRRLIGRIGAHALHAKVKDEGAHTAPARTAFLNRFEREVDPDGTLSPDERARRIEHARKAYFAQLALKSAQARRANREAKQQRAEAARVKRTATDAYNRLAEAVQVAEARLAEAVSGIVAVEAENAARLRDARRSRDIAACLVTDAKRALEAYASSEDSR